MNRSALIPLRRATFSGVLVCIAMVAPGCRQILGIEDKTCSADAIVSDRHNCGACGHDCLGGACSFGRCEPVVLDGAPHATSLALSEAGYVYYPDWTGNHVWGALKDGSAPPFLLDGKAIVDSPFAVTADETDVYWGTSTKASTGILFRHPLGGGPTERVTDGWPGIFSLRTNESSVFFFVGGAPDAELVQIPKKGGAPSVLFDAPKYATPRVSALAVDDLAAYVAYGDLLRIDAKTGVKAVLVKNVSSLSPLAVDESDVYFSTDGSLLRVAKDGQGEPVMLANADATNLAVDEASIYWTESGTTDVLRMQSKTGSGPPETLANGLPRVSEIAVAGEAIYWAEADAHRIVKLAR